MEKESRSLAKIKSLSRFLLAVTRFLMLVLPLLAPLCMLFYNQLPASVRSGMDAAAPASLSLALRLAGVALALPTSVLLFLVLRSLSKLLGRYALGNLFDLENAHHARRAAWLLLASTLYGLLLFKPLSPLILRYHELVASRSLTLGFGFTQSDLLALFASLFLLLVSWIGVEGHRLKEDADLTI